jgi:hypothetical protein
MPYTPLHMGPGMIVKAMIPRHFSIVAFGIAQVLIDLEVLWHMVRYNRQDHTFFHTYLGASLIVLAAALLGKPVSTAAMRMWNVLARHVAVFDLSVPRQATWKATFLGAGIGAYSHVLFDSFYHLDIEPFQPWSAANPCRGILSQPFQMEVAFNILLILGILWFTVGEFLRRRNRQTPRTSVKTIENHPE